MALAHAPAPVPIRLEIIRKHAWVPDHLAHALRDYSPRTEFGRLVRACALALPDPAMAAELLEGISRVVVIESALALLARRRDSETGIVTLEDHGVVSRKVVTTAGVGFLVDSWQNILEMETMKYHGIGTGTNAEASADTALQTELTTEYNPNSTRATGSLTEGASANIFRSVGTNTLDSGTPAITEHGLLSQAATGGGTLWDRSVFSAINLVGANADALTSQYDLTASAGG
jgi:hypothetical protein